MKPKGFLLTITVAISVATFTILQFFNSISQRSAIDVGIYVIYILGGLILAGAPFDRKRMRTGWARTLFVLSGLVLAFIGASELLRHYGVWLLSEPIEHGFAYMLTLLRGVVLGFLFALLFSGELAGRKLSARASA